MDQIIRQHACQSSGKEAIVDGSSSLTYSGLLAAAEHYAHALGSNGKPGHGELVGILLPPGLKQVVAQVAVRLFGAVCVPIGVVQPIKRIKSMLHDIQVDKVLVSEELAHEFSEFVCVPVRDILASYSEDIQGLVSNPPNGDGETTGQWSHILFTSGSTGKPKPVPILEQSIVHLSRETNITPLSKEDRVAEFNDPGFDLSLFEIWTTLLSGATIVVIPKNVVTDPGALPSFLKVNRITVTIMPTALFNIVASVSPYAFNGLRHVLVAGETANSQSMRAVLKSHPPQHIWNAYGPTECTTMVTMFEVTIPETERGRISIGFPVGKTQVFLIDENGNAISDSETRGEICIAGPGVSPGYLNRDIENAERFITIQSQPDRVVRAYRTGDLGEWRSDLPACLDFFGRLDNQVKYNGFRIDLGEVESILQSNDMVTSAAVLKQAGNSSTSLASLVAYVSLRKDAPKEYSSGSLLRTAKENLPPYMVPSRIEVLDRLPLTPNGKIDRGALQGPLGKACQGGGDDQPPTAVGNEANWKSAVIQVWRDVLNISSVSEDDDFFDLGGDSMQSAAFIASIRDRIGRVVAMDELERNSRLGDLLRFLELKATDHNGNADDTLVWKAGIDLVDALTWPGDAHVPDWESDSEGKVFITGVTGFVGVHMLYHLLHRPTVKQVACLVRRKKGHGSSASRVQKTMERYDLVPLSPESSQKLVVLEGEMAEEDLGLGRDQFDWLASWASVIFHVGAKVNFCESYQQHYRSNVLGTYHVLRLAVQGRCKAFHYMSSIDVWGPTGYVLGTREVFEDGSLIPHLQALRYDLGYAQSQWTAEGMVRRMQEERGLPTAIYRPGFIIGDSRTGVSNPDDFVTRFIVGCIQMGTFPRVVDMRFEYATIDFVVEATLHIASNNKNLGRCYHLLSPDQSKSITIEETCGLINRTGYHVKMIDYHAWVQQVLLTQPPGSPLAPLIPVLQERVLGEMTRWEAGQYSPRYDTTNAVNALASRPDIQHVPFTTDILRKSIEFWNKKGFYQV